MTRGVSFETGLATTAMGILPHEDIDKALELALTLDIPFWPQLPKVSFYEDMYVQALERFPGVVFDERAARCYIDTERFYGELDDFFAHDEDIGHFVLSDGNSLAYRRFLERDLSRFVAVHGQVISPVSLTLKIVDENGMPIVYNDDIRTVAFSFIQKRLNAQYRELAARNEHAFVWIDDPGLEFIFNAMSGYDHMKARNEMHEFYEGVEGPRGLHLCGNPDWDFLLSLNIGIISLNAYGFGDIFVNYDRVKDFVKGGGTISWGIVPTYEEEFAREDAGTMADRLVGMWKPLTGKGLTLSEIAERSLLAPATCNLLNPDRTETVERAFRLLGELSERLRERNIP
jgi:hypothetical protein